MRLKPMRLTPLAFALLLGLSPMLHAQEAAKTFTGLGTSEALACDAANKQARDWVKGGKAEGRLRSLVDPGKCSCTVSNGASVCTLDVRVTDAQREEEEER